ncbi:uncharacterized protein LOC124293079 isoform X2 [Neodiprion lecontei]|uniref:Uncharacterized protein LOC124293079 isoform X2 n=1 Tax=Neodiprion lecontei TaxID=441921 RepID=A0ABM3FJW4_NEOLC|nr:uncharacterized protein LOC124293079 isoform X2 [Neodiprion lecontei]
MDVNIMDSLPGGFFNFVKHTYGDRALHLIKSWAKLTSTRAGLLNRRVFLLQCRSNKKSVLNVEIKITIWKLQKVNEELGEICNQLKSLIPQPLFDNCKSVNKVRFSKIFTRIKEVNMKKLEELVQQRLNGIRLPDANKCVFNYTNRELPKQVYRTLSLEPNFGLQIQNKITIVPEVIKDLEYCISAVKLDNCNAADLSAVKENLRSKSINILSNFCKGQSRSEDRLMLNKDLIVTKKFLRENEDLVVSRSDKGNSTVIMFREEYEREMSALISDRTTYLPLHRDPTLTYQKRANNLVAELASSGVIDEAEEKNLRSSYTRAPRIYGLRKTHKPTCKLRPVVSCIQSPSYKLSRVVHEILTPVVDTFSFNLLNSFQFVDFIRDVELHSDYRLISLDVVSLFTNIRKDLVLKVINESWDNIKHLVKVPKFLLIKLIEFCFETSYFTYNGVLYRQVEGCSMGNPASPVLANIVMNYVLQQIITVLPFNIAFIKLYVDDTIAAVPETELNRVLELFNSFEENIQFTMEVEQNGCIPFLDIMVERSNNHLKTNWYTKPTSSGRILNFCSNHPMSQKVGMIHGLLDRMFRLSSEEYHEDNYQKIEILLTNNSYPRSFVRAAIIKFKENKANGGVGGVRPTNFIKYCRFPFVPGLSHKINSCFTGTNVKLAYYNVYKIKSLYTKLKDPVQQDQRAGVVYKIPCSCGLCYVGQTKQYLKNRIYQHRNSCRNVKILDENKTALAAHYFDSGHGFDFDKAKILDLENNWLKRSVSEMVWIKLNDTVNKRTDTQNLSAMYNEILSVYNDYLGDAR